MKTDPVKMEAFKAFYTSSRQQLSNKHPPLEHPVPLDATYKRVQTVRWQPELSVPSFT